MPRLRNDVAAVARVFLDGLRTVLADDLVGFYLYGALTFPDSQDVVRDIDYHVIVHHPFDDQRRQEVARVKEDVLAVAERFGLELDGYVITFDDARRTVPPAHQMWPLVRSAPCDDSWALHCAHIRAGQVVVPCGPNPLEIYPEPSWPELAAALFGEIRFVEQAIPENPAYAVLNACRLLYSFTTRDVVTSKRAGALWARERLTSEWHLLIDAAVAAYQSIGVSESPILSDGVELFVATVWHEIARQR